MEQLDLKKKFGQLYKPSSKKIEIIEIPALQFAMLDGAIEAGLAPGTSHSFQQAVEALYSISYTLKFAFKKRADKPIDYPVMPLEALWWVERSGRFNIKDPTNWHWTVMLMQPEIITPDEFAHALTGLAQRKPNPSLRQVRLETFHEGLCVQTMHIGPYPREPETVAAMEAFVKESGYEFQRKHHEIYLSDPRRANPENMKTILRHAVLKKA